MKKGFYTQTQGKRWRLKVAKICRAYTRVIEKKSRIIATSSMRNGYSFTYDRTEVYKQACVSLSTLKQSNSFQLEGQYARETIKCKQKGWRLI